MRTPSVHPLQHHFSLLPISGALRIHPRIASTHSPKLKMASKSKPSHPNSLCLVCDHSRVGRSYVSSTNVNVLITDDVYSLCMRFIMVQLMCLHFVSMNVIGPQRISLDLSQLQPLLRNRGSTTMDDVCRCLLIGLILIVVPKQVRSVPSIGQISSINIIIHQPLSSVPTICSERDTQ